MASKINTKPETSIWAKRNAERLRKEHTFKFDVGDLVSKYPGNVWEIQEIRHDSVKGPMYYLVREVGNNRKRWKTVWSTEPELVGAFVR